MDSHMGFVWERDAKVVCMNIADRRNLEMYISQELKKKKMHLEGVVYNPNRTQLRLYFNPEASHTKPNNFVKQVSKKKYTDWEEFINLQAIIDREALLAVVELTHVYLLFFSEYAK